MIEGISAVTLGTHEMPRAVRFYRALGFEVLHGGEESSFTGFRAGTSYLQPHRPACPAAPVLVGAGNLLYVADVDALYRPCTCSGIPAKLPCPAMPNGVSAFST